MGNDSNMYWYAIRVTYNRELKVRDDLILKGIKYFLPMHYIEKIRFDKRLKILVPAIHNLIFMHCSKEKMIEYKDTTALPIRYIIDNTTNKPTVIPDKQMNNFIAVAGNYSEQIVYLDYDIATMKRGDRVKVIGGIFEGAEGEFVRIKGDRRVVVIIPGIAAVATTYIHPSLIKRIEI